MIRTRRAGLGRRAPADDEWYLDSPGRLVVLEPVPEGETP